MAFSRFSVTVAGLPIDVYLPAGEELQAGAEENDVLKSTVQAGCCRVSGPERINCGGTTTVVLGVHVDEPGDVGASGHFVLISACAEHGESLLSSMQHGDLAFHVSHE